MLSRGSWWLSRAFGRLVCLPPVKKNRWCCAKVDEEKCFLTQNLLFLHPFDCLVLEKSPTLAIRGLNVGDVMSFVHRSPFVGHYLLQGVMDSCLLSLVWLVFLEVQNYQICRSVGLFLSCNGYSVDLEYKCGFIDITL